MKKFPDKFIPDKDNELLFNTIMLFLLIIIPVIGALYLEKKVSPLKENPLINLTVQLNEDYLEEIYQKINNLSIGNKVEINKEIYLVKDIQSIENLKHITFENKNETIILTMDNKNIKPYEKTITIKNINLKCGYIIDWKNRQYKNIKLKNPNSDNNWEESNWIKSDIYNLNKIFLDILYNDKFKKCDENIIKL